MWGDFSMSRRCMTCVISVKARFPLWYVCPCYIPVTRLRLTVWSPHLCLVSVPVVCFSASGYDLCFAVSARVPFRCMSGFCYCVQLTSQGLVSVSVSGFLVRFPFLCSVFRLSVWSPFRCTFSLSACTHTVYKH